MRTIFVLLAIVLSLVAIQAAQAEIVQVFGKVTAIEHNTVTLDSGYIVSSLGPKAYWKSEGMTYPKVGEYLYIDAYVGEALDKLVAVEVCYDAFDSDNCIILRDFLTLVPLWIGFQTTETSALSTTVTAATGCICDKCYCNCPKDCPDCPCDCSCDCTCDGTGPKGPKK